jgi:hypothetical protein
VAGLDHRVPWYGGPPYRSYGARRRESGRVSPRDPFDPRLRVLGPSHRNGLEHRPDRQRHGPN